MTTKNNLQSIFSAQLKSHRIQKGLSQTALARKLGTTPGFVCDYERGRRNPTLLTVERFAIALGIKPENLLK